MWRIVQTPGSQRYAAEPGRNARGVLVAIGLAVLLALTGGACGSKSSTSSGTPGTSGSKPTTTAARVLTAAQLKTAALVAGDLPAGWSPYVSSSTGTATSTGSTSSSSASLCPAGSDLTKKETHDKAEADFSKSATGPLAFQTIGTAPDAAAHYADMKHSLDSCMGQSWTSTENGESWAYTFESASAPQVGEQSVAYRVTGKAASGYSMTMDFVLAQRGSVVQLYSGTTLAGVPGATPLDAAEFATIAKTGDKKIATALNNL